MRSSDPKMPKGERFTWFVAGLLALVILYLAYRRFILHTVPTVRGINA